MSQVPSTSVSEQEIFKSQESFENCVLHSEISGVEEGCESPQAENRECCAIENSLSEAQCCMSESASVHEEEHPESEPGHHQDKEKSHKQHYDTFTKELEALSDPEAKLKHTTSFMEMSLSTKNGTPHFKSFWDARNIALLLFKENINPAVRSDLWGKYSELSKEARRLKEILDEQSAFASEQIEIAIQALEKDLENTQENLEKTPIADFIQNCYHLEPKKDYYYAIQRELTMLNTHAIRISALRKELIRTEMRIRQKNKFFQRLSSAGDKVFPRRKELIKEMSQHFNDDVETFIKKHFAKEEDYNESLFTLREEIKALQGVAKHITLNTQSFTHTRMRLSECWDKLKHLDKERKKVRAQMKVVFKENADKLFSQLKEIGELMQSGQMNHSEAQRKLDDVVNEMRRVDLGKDELRALRDELSALRKPILDKVKQEEQDRIDQAEERDRQRKFKTQEVKNQIEDLFKSIENFDAEGLTAKRDELFAKINELSCTKLEKQELERQLKPLKDAISDKKEKALMTLSEDDRQTIQQLREILKQRKERRQEIKSQIEVFRKASGNSGFDFEQAMSYTSQMAAEKDRLEKINHGIKEIEDKISELENKG